MSHYPPGREQRRSETSLGAFFKVATILLGLLVGIGSIVFVLMWAVELAGFSLAKANARIPDWMTFNGYAGRYVTHPLTANPGELVRFWVVDAGPSIDTDFHVVGTLLNTAYPFGDMDPARALHNVQTVKAPAGGGAVFDVKIDQAGAYPFVSHAFSAVNQGQAGLLNVGKVAGTMSH
jgi:nitrite reductase (NO-forming)